MTIPARARHLSWSDPPKKTQVIDGLIFVPTPHIKFNPWGTLFQWWETSDIGDRPIEGRWIQIKC